MLNQNKKLTHWRFSKLFCDTFRVSVDLLMVLVLFAVQKLVFELAVLPAGRTEMRRSWKL